MSKIKIEIKTSSIPSTRNLNIHTDTQTNMGTTTSKRDNPTVREMWEFRVETSVGLPAMCNTCGGGSISSCECVYSRFVNNVEYFDILRFKWFTGKKSRTAVVQSILTG